LSLKDNSTPYQLQKLDLSPYRNLIPPILLGGFSPNTFLRIVNYADGWIPVAGFGPLEQLEQAINGLRERARKTGKGPSKIRIFVLTYPNIPDSSSSKEQRLSMTGTSDQIGSDIARIKAMDVEHIIFGHAFSPGYEKDMKKMIEVTKQFATFAK
jgi:alkanesulfonate monooxygenase SsuD/methylene tetrahydromethanopterin reductase-like flavin-dependent oxidoreductase (luciferase family)